MPWLNDLGAAFVGRGHGLVLRRNHRSLAGTFAVAAPGHRHFLSIHLREDAEAWGAVQVLDSESCRLLPRLFDVYFLLSWDDGCHGLHRPDLGLARLRHSLECSGGWTPEERKLLPDLLKLKALSNAAWCCEGQRSWRQRPRARCAMLRNSLTIAGPKLQSSIQSVQPN